MTLADGERIAFYIAFSGYFVAMLAYILYLPFQNQSLVKFASYTALLGVLGNTTAIVLRMLLTVRPPLANGYEFTLTFAWGIVAVYLFVEYRYKIRILGAFVLPCAFFLLAFVILFMSSEERVASYISPALRSNWLTFHVVMAIFGYGTLAISFGLGILYLVKCYLVNKSLEGQLNSRIPGLARLDLMGYKMIVLGFPLLTLCIFSGAIWADYAWGTYWSWDPKETWSLITWIIYAIYLHTRLMFRWKGKHSAWVAVIGFLAVLFTFFGVNYFISGLHSYA